MGLNPVIHKTEFCLNHLFLLSSYMLRNMYFGLEGHRVVRYPPDGFSVVGIFGDLLVQCGVVLKCLTWHKYNTDKTFCFIGGISALKNSPLS